MCDPVPGRGMGRGVGLPLSPEHHGRPVSGTIGQSGGLQSDSRRSWCALGRQTAVTTPPTLSWQNGQHEARGGKKLRRARRRLNARADANTVRVIGGSIVRLGVPVGVPRNTGKSAGSGQRLPDRPNFFFFLLLRTSLGEERNSLTLGAHAAVRSPFSNSPPAPRQRAGLRRIVNPRPATPPAILTAGSSHQPHQRSAAARQGAGGASGCVQKQKHRKRFDHLTAGGAPLTHVPPAVPASGVTPASHFLHLAWFPSPPRRTRLLHLPTGSSPRPPALT